MTKAKRSEGPRAPLFYCVLAFAPASLALAQSVDVAELEECTGLETDALKLACFEAIVAGAGEALEPVPEPPAEAPPEPEPAQPVSTSITAAAEFESRPEKSAPVASSAEASPTTATAASAVSEPVERAKEAKPDVMHATVVEVTKDGYGALIFHFDNGQVWGQREKRYFPYPKNRQFDVTISTGMMGENRMQVEGAGRKVTIRRLR